MLLAGLTWHGAASGAAALGLALGTVGRWQRDPLRLRWLFVGSAFGWASHNLLVGSPFGLATDTLTLITNGWRIWREPRRRSDTGAGTMRGWIGRRVERHSRQMAAMMARVGVEAEAAASRGRAYEAATRRCLWCPVAASCRQWLDDPAGDATAMPFACPNAPFFESLRPERP